MGWALMGSEGLATPVLNGKSLFSGAGPEWLWKGRVPALDGLRAIAIGLVIVAHARGTVHAPFPQFVWTFGDLGVELFFVISGFLITLLLLRERRRVGTISLKQFYLRRAVRIFPAFLSFLAFLAFLQLSNLIQIEGKIWLLSLTFTLNLQTWAPWDIGHLWSLCVEEHFYLVWPPVFAILGSTWSCRIAWVVICSAPLWRWLIGIEFPGYLAPESFTFARMDAIAMGCCLAVVLSNDANGRLCQFSRSKSLAVWLSIFVLLLISRILHTSRLKNSDMALLFSHTMEGVAFTLLIWVTICSRSKLVAKTLNLKPLVLLGVLSYSLYLWQQPFLNKGNTSWFCEWPINVIIALFFATCSYNLVERPFLNWRKRHGSAA